jgi:hypothetical protein
MLKKEATPLSPGLGRIMMNRGLDKKESGYNVSFCNQQSALKV